MTVPEVMDDLRIWHPAVFQSLNEMEGAVNNLNQWKQIHEALLDLEMNYLSVRDFLKVRAWLDLKEIPDPRLMEEINSFIQEHML